jgi:large subunit ribosomal protein L23
MSIIIKPIITEKATLGSELHNRYTFLVHPKANKIEIKTGIQKGKSNATKKAVVHVVEGDAIDFYSNL